MPSQPCFPTITGALAKRRTTDSIIARNVLPTSTQWRKNSHPASKADNAAIFRPEAAPYEGAASAFANPCELSLIPSPFPVRSAISSYRLVSSLAKPPRSGLGLMLVGRTIEFASQGKPQLQNPATKNFLFPAPAGIHCSMPAGIHCS